MIAQALADLASQAMPRTAAYLTRMSAFLSAQDENFLGLTRVEHEQGFALLISHANGLIRSGGITVEGWDRLEDLDNHLHDVFFHVWAGFTAE